VQRDDADDEIDIPRPSVVEMRGYARAVEVIEATRKFQHRIEVAVDQALEGYAVTFAQYRALEAVADRPGHVSYIARKVRVTRQATEAVVEKLSRAGLVDVTRLGHFTDVEISAQGRRWLQGMRDAIQHHVAAPIEREITPNELFHMLHLMRKADHLCRPHKRPTWWLED
jgi:DNA-binding MarR family transcriptional regulator